MAYHTGVEVVSDVCTNKTPHNTVLIAYLLQTYELKKDAVVYSRRGRESRGKHKFV